MNCEQLMSAAHDYFLRTLPAGPRAEFDAHAESCSACGEFVRVCREITCREVNEFLDQYVGGELPPERRAVFERHLAICSDCLNYLESYKLALRAAQASFSARALQLPASMPEELVRAILASSRGE
jgi:anti-sigma factor RsiW